MKLTSDVLIKTARLARQIEFDGKVFKPQDVQFRLAQKNEYYVSPDGFINKHLHQNETLLEYPIVVPEKQVTFSYTSCTFEEADKHPIHQHVRLCQTENGSIDYYFQYDLSVKRWLKTVPPVDPPSTDKKLALYEECSREESRTANGGDSELAIWNRQERRYAYVKKIR